MADLLSFLPSDLHYVTACQARDRFWARYGVPQGPCLALGLHPEQATYCLAARVAVESDRAGLPSVFEGFKVQVSVGGSVPQER